MQREQLATLKAFGYSNVQVLMHYLALVSVIVALGALLGQMLSAIERLGGSYRLEASFVLWEEKDVVQVPASALFRESEGWAVFVLADGLAQKRAIEVGRRNGLRAQILTGIVAGEPVVVHPDDQVVTGIRIKAR